MDLVAFGLALLAVSAVPGPVVTLLTARALAGDAAGAARFAAGIALGKVIILSAILAGVGAVLGGGGDLMALLRALGVAYLAWVSVCLWREAGADAVSGPQQEPCGALLDLGAGLVASLSSPYLLVFFLTALPGPDAVVLPPMPAVLAVTVLASAAAHGAYIVLAARLRPLLVDPLHRGRVRRVMAGTIAVAALWFAIG